MTGSLFSIGITVYNMEAFVERAIRSAMNQTYQPIELVIVDDGSTDRSTERAEALVAEHPCAQFIRQPNSGYGAALKTAIDAATGEGFGILDADDLLFPRAVESVVRAFESHPEADFLWSQFIRSDGIFSESRPLSDHVSILEDWPCGHFRAFRTACYRRSAQLDPTIRAAVDRDLFLKLEEVGNGLFLDELLYFYRINPNGISESRRDEQIECEQEIKRQALERRGAAHKHRRS